MRSLLIICLVSCLPLLSFAQKEKIVERSDREKPSWIGRTDKLHIAVTEVGTTLAEASGKCMTAIRQYVVNSVAVNISAMEQMSIYQINRDNLMTVINDYSSSVVTEAASLPYISDLSLSNAEDVYWEKIYDRRNKTYRYEYSVLYPFDEGTRRELVDWFIDRDNSKMEHCRRLRDRLDTIDDIDEIKSAVNELDGLYDYFFDPVRKNDVDVLRKNYRSLYSQIRIETEAEEFGKCTYCLMLGDRRVTTSVAPRINGDSIIEASVYPGDNKNYVLVYNGEYASSTEINTIEILYMVGGVRISRIIYFDPNTNH